MGSDFENFSYFLGSSGVRLSGFVPTGSGFVLMVKNGLHFDQEHLFTIKPDPKEKQILNA